MARRPCLGAGGLPCPDRALVDPGPRCSRCARREDAPRRAVYDSRRWRNLSRRRIDAHLAQHGPWCPGAPGHAPHASHDLTLDHVVPFELGGAPFDPGNTRVLCRAWNSRLARAGRREGGR